MPAGSYRFNHAGGGPICAVHQPNFLPRLTTLAKLYAADYWIVLDDVQFVRRDYQHRARIASLHDTDVWQWLSLPVHLPFGQRTAIADVELTEPTKTPRRVNQLLQQYYRRSPHWPHAKWVLGEVLDAMESTDRLAPVAEASTRALLTVLGWRGELVHSSGLPARPGRSERLLDLTRAVGSQRYLCGTGGAKYLDPAPFEDAGIDVEYFSAPASGPALWRASNRITSLWAMMTVGPTRLSIALREHAEGWRSSPSGT